MNTSINLIGSILLGTIAAAAAYVGAIEVAVFSMGSGVWMIAFTLQDIKNKLGARDD